MNSESDFEDECMVFLIPKVKDKMHRLMCLSLYSTMIQNLPVL